MDDSRDLWGFEIASNYLSLNSEITDVFRVMSQREDMLQQRTSGKLIDVDLCGASGTLQSVSCVHSDHVQDNPLR